MWGQVDSIVDPDGNRFKYTYSARSEPIRLDNLPSSIAQRWGYDSDGRLKGDTLDNPTITFPRWLFPTLRKAEHRYDGRDKLLWRGDPVVYKDTTQFTYSGLGTLINSKYTMLGIDQVQGANVTIHSGSTDNFSVDPLGNIVDGATFDTLQVSNQPTETSRRPRTATFQPNVGRILTDSGVNRRMRTFAYDSAGNEAFSSLVGAFNFTSPSEDRRSYYDASGRLVATEWRWIRFEQAGPVDGFKIAYEEYRYDPFGRRIWVNAQRSCEQVPSPMPDVSGESIECSRSFVRRTVWDGQQELAEIQAPDDTTNREVDVGYYTAQPLVNGKDPNPYYGRVIYTHGLTIDQPLSIFRLGYADWPFGGSYTNTWGNFVVMPFWDGTGNARIGTFGDGAAVKQLTPGPGPDCGFGTSPQRCVQLYWPETYTSLDRLKGYTPQSFMGSLLDRKRDNNGTEFKRNRVYDARTGRFWS